MLSSWTERPRGCVHHCLLCTSVGCRCTCSQLPCEPSLSRLYSPYTALKDTPRTPRTSSPLAVSSSPLEHHACAEDTLRTVPLIHRVHLADDAEHAGSAQRALFDEARAPRADCAMATRSENVRRFGVTADHARGVAGSLRRRRRLFPGCTALSVALSQQRRAPPDSISQSRRCRTSRRCGYPLLNFSPSRLNLSCSLRRCRHSCRLGISPRLVGLCLRCDPLGLRLRAHLLSPLSSCSLFRCRFCPQL
eukprot:scaffold12312_cov63-Phaeocystis_antarctica.AAC.14